MNITELTGQLKATIEIIKELVRVSVEQARWKPAPDRWSILEVINHLFDEEREDFRRRIDLTLHHPGKPWPPIDPPGWPESRNYNEQNLDESIQKLAQERVESIEWLVRLDSPDWELTYEHPEIGPVRAGDLMASWVTHDFLHIRQLIRLRKAWADRMIVPYKSDYAGS